MYLFLLACMGTEPTRAYHRHPQRCFLLNEFSGSPALDWIYSSNKEQLWETATVQLDWLTPATKSSYGWSWQSSCVTLTDGLASNAAEDAQHGSAITSSWMSLNYYNHTHRSARTRWTKCTCMADVPAMLSRLMDAHGITTMPPTSIPSQEWRTWSDETWR